MALLTPGDIVLGGGFIYDMRSDDTEALAFLRNRPNGDTGRGSSVIFSDSDPEGPPQAFERCLDVTP